MTDEGKQFPIPLISQLKLTASPRRSLLWASSKKVADENFYFVIDQLMLSSRRSSDRAQGGAPGNHFIAGEDTKSNSHQNLLKPSPMGKVARYKRDG